MDFKPTSSQLNFYTKNAVLDSTIWNQSLIVAYSKVYSYEQLNNAMNFLRRDHEGLRVKFKETFDGLVSYVEDYEHINFPFIKVSSEEEMLDEAMKFVNTPMDFYGMLVNPIIFQTPTKSGIMISAHHIAIDGYCSFILAEDINKYLQDPEYRVETQAYTEHIAKEEKHKQSKRFASDKEFWKNQFSTNPTCNIFSSQKTTLDFDAVDFNKEIPAELIRKIKVFCAENEISPSSFFNAVYAEYLHRVYDIEHFTIGVPVLNRTSQAELNTIGLYMHIVPLVVKLEPDSFFENTKRIEDSWLNIFRHQKFTQYDIRQMLSENNMPINTLYDITADFLEFAPNEDYEILIPYGTKLTVPMELHMQSFSEEKCRFRICYQKALFTESEVQTMFDSIVSLMQNAIENPFENIHSLEIISKEEKQKVLYNFNDTALEYSKDKGVYELFEKQAQENPDKLAVVFKDKKLTYSQLNNKVCECADKLCSLNIKAKDVVAVHLERSYELIVFQLAILKIGAIFLPVDKRYPVDRIQQMCTNCDVKLLISDELDKVTINNANVTLLSEFKSVASTKNATTVTNLEDCYIIYTSGSTGTPKGCLLTGKGLLNFCLNNNTLETLNNIESPIFACVNSSSFDYFIAETLLPLTNGFATVVLDNSESTMQDLFLDVVAKNNINVIMTTPTRLKIYFNDKHNCSALKDIACICTSGEPLTPDLLEQMYTKSPNAMVYNPIGPSECSVWDMGGRLEKADGLDIHIGKPIANAQIYIVDKYLNPTPIGVTGEICIAGDGVGSGYINNPKLTAEKFIVNPFGDGKLYKTGDLAYWREDGNICYVGRNDFQVKVRGLRIELGEIENTLERIDGIELAVAVVRKDEQDRQFICAFYTGKEMETTDLRTILSAKLPKYMVPHSFTHIEEMPVTSNGKINRNNLPKVDLKNISTETEYIAPTTKKEAILAKSVENVLDIEKVSMVDNFFDLGGDSLKSIELIDELESNGYTVNVKEIFEAKNIQSLAEKLIEKTEIEEKVEYNSVLPATAAQMSVYKAQIIDGNSTLYNIPTIFQVEELDSTRLQSAINTLVERHESLRTHFENRNGKVVQVINDNATVKVEKLETDNPLDFIKPFNLEEAPLLRVGYYKNTVMIDMHHIIADGSSIAILFKELNELYMGRELPETVQYGEFAVVETYTKDDEEYWLNEFNEVPVLELHTDFPKTEAQSFKGTNIYTRIDNKLNESIQSKCKQLGVTPYAYYMSCYNILLSKFSGMEDICVGVPSSGRNGKHINTLGMFVNMLSLRSQPTGIKTFNDFVNEIKEKSIDAISHQSYPQQEILKKINSKKTLYDVMFSYQSEEMTEIIFGDKKANIIPTPINTAKCDMSFYIFPRENETVLMTEYCTDLFKKETINKIIDAYTSILTQCLDECKQIKDISILTAKEKEKVLNEFNDTKVEYAKDKCIHKLFEEQVERTPDKIALVAIDKTVTYKELNEEANKIANSLIEKGIGKGDIVGLMLPRKSCLLSALIGILKTGAAYLPIDMELPAERIEYMRKDTNACLVISSNNIDSLMESVNITNPNVEMTNDSLCYCIYTSGSTGQPKGVMAMHKNVVNYISKNEHNIFGKIVKEDFEAIVSISTCSFDIFVTETVATLVNGLRVVLADEQACRNQYALNRLLTKEKGEFLQTTPTKLKALTKEPSQRDFLRNVKAILLGGEAMEESYLNELKGITNAKIYNIYGVTEVPIWSAFVDTDTFTDAITIGHGIANTQMYIVDKYLNPVPIGMMGELCIAGDSVSKGYLNQPDLTAKKFIDNPFGEGKLYKTGDHAYWREDGSIVFVGRKDFQVKIRGLRIELGEIESVLQAIEGIERAVVVVRKDNEDRQLLCAFYTGNEINAKDLRAIVDARLPKYMVPHIFTHLEKMPMTASGKANRNALPDIDLSNISTEIEYVAPTTKEEIILTNAVEAVLNIEKVSTLDNFFDLGGDSLKSIELVSKLEENGYTVIIKSIFNATTIQELAKELIEKFEKEEKVEYDSVLPATAAQMRIYTSQLLSPEAVHYNILTAFKTNDLDVEKLNKAFNRLIARHESLRTSFENRDGQIVQVINDTSTIEVQKLSSEDVSQLNTPFDLSAAPLLRVGYYNNTVMVVTHHIIVDGTSFAILFKEFNELYMGRELKETVQYGEFAVTDSYTKENEKYWLDVFSEEINTLDLPTDFQRPEAQSFNGTNIFKQIDNKLNEDIQEKCKQLGITPYAFYFACYNILLSKFSGNEDICVGVPSSGRSSKFLNTIGMFVNTVAIRTNTDGNKIVNTLMQETKENAILAIDNQSYPFNELVKKLNLLSTNRNPLYDVMFAYQSEEMTEITLGDKKAEVIPTPLSSSKCDLSFFVYPRENETVLMVEYCTDLYKENTINKFINAYCSILTQCLDDTKRIKDIIILSDEEKNAILKEFNNTCVEYKKDICVLDLFNKQVEKAPDHIALVASDKALTYKELNEASNKFAHSLIEKGIGTGDIVGIKLSRTSKFLISLLGVLKSGAAYLPMDVDHPQGRIDSILEDSKAKLCVTEENFEELFDNANIENPNVEISSDTLCYCIYTSGSTGKPKGAMLQHKNLCWYMASLKSIYGEADIHMPFFTSPSVDLSVTSIFFPLVTGGTTYFYSDDLLTNITNIINNEKLTIIKLTPTHIQIINQSIPAKVLTNLQHLIVGGEQLYTQTCVDFLENFGNHIKIHNEYGPTETTVGCGDYVFNFDDTHIAVSIGHPMNNVQLYIVDKNTKLLPIGVIGELCIAGDGVCAGYLNREDLTNEKFIPNPFGEGKLYKTGDLAYWREDGNIYYVGRNDFQVKINGQRVELGEIENAIASIDGVVQCAVIVREQFVCAFYTGNEINTKELRTILSAKLPRYMVPHSFTHLEALPMTVSGKLDRKALPEIDLANISNDIEIVAPTTKEEQALAHVLSSVLNVESVNMLDNFFNIGGDSITAIYVVSDLEDKGYELLVADIMQSDTLLDVAKAMKSTSNADIYEQTEVEAFVPFSPIMRAYLNKRDDIAKDFVQTCILSTNCDEATAKKAIDALVSHHDMLRGAFTDNGIIIQPSTTREVYSFETIAIDNENEATKSLLNTALDDDKLVKVVFCKTTNGNLICITVHHFLIDLISWEVLAKDFTIAVNQLTNNRDISLPAKSASFKLWNEELESYCNITENKAYWESVNQQLDSAKSFNTYEEENAEETFTFEFSKDTSSKLINEVNNAYGTRINEILITALGLAASKLANGSTGIMIESHGRAQLPKRVAIERTIGWFTSCYPVIVNNTENIANEIISVKDTLRRIPTNGIEYLLLNNGLHKNTDIMFNFYKNSISNDSRENKLLAFGGNSVFPGTINVNCFVMDNILSINIYVPKYNHKPGISEILGAEFVSQINKIVDFCTATETVIKTRSDFTDDTLTQSELDELTELFDWGDNDE